MMPTYIPCRLVTPLAILLLAGCASAPAPTTKTSQPHSRNAVEGAITVDGKSFRLGHIYALKLKSPYFYPQQQDKKGEDIDMVEVVMTNVPVSGDMLDKIVHDEYYGSDKIKGVAIRIDPAGKNSWYAQLLLDSGPVFEVGTTAVFAGGVTWVMGGPVLEQDRVRGQITFRSQEALVTRTYKVAFEAPLTQASSRAAAHASAADTQTVLAACNANMLGDWSIERWTTPGENSEKGTLTVDRKVDEHAFHGLFHFNRGLGGVDAEEDVAVTCKDGVVLVDGRSATDPRWAMDHLVFDWNGDRLLGGGKDERGTIQRVDLRKQRR